MIVIIVISLLLFGFAYFRIKRRVKNNWQCNCYSKIKEIKEDD